MEIGEVAKSKLGKVAILICGYRRSGKDTLATDLMSSDTKKLERWNFYCNWVSPNNNEIDYNSLCTYTRKAFAQTLKEEASKIIGIPVEEIDKRKEEFWREGETIRSFLISYATKEREKDVDCWCKKALMDLPEYLIITDFRFPNELEYVKSHYEKVITIRVVSRSVSVPSPEDMSERSLDNLLTDYVVVPNDREYSSIKEYKNMLKLFPQYQIFP